MVLGLVSMLILVTACLPIARDSINIADVVFTYCNLHQRTRDTYFFECVSIPIPRVDDVAHGSVRLSARGRVLSGAISVGKHASGAALSQWAHSLPNSTNPEFETAVCN